MPSIPIARQDTLEEVKALLETGATAEALAALQTAVDSAATAEDMAAVKELVQDSGGDVTHNIWLMDYKSFGTDSYVYNDKDKLHELYEDLPLSMNDTLLNGEVLAYFNAAGTGVGTALSNVYGIDSSVDWASLNTISDVVGSSTAMEAVAASSTAMGGLLGSSEGVAAAVGSSTAMEAVAASSTAMEAVVGRSTAMEAVAASSTAMKAVAASAPALNLIAKNSTARKYFAASSYLQTNYTAILASLGNTKYFTAAVSVGTIVYSTADRYYNGANYSGTTSALSADACFVLVHAFRAYTSANSATLYDLPNLTLRYSTKSVTSKTINYVFPGGMRTVYSSESTYSVYKAI